MHAKQVSRLKAAQISVSQDNQISQPVDEHSTNQFILNPATHCSKQIIKKHSKMTYLTNIFT